MFHIPWYLALIRIDIVHDLHKDAGRDPIEANDRKFKVVVTRLGLLVEMVDLQGAEVVRSAVEERL